MYDWGEFERLITEAKTYLPQKMNSTQRGVAMGFFLRGIEQTGGGCASVPRCDVCVARW